MYDSVCRGLQSIQEILFQRFATASKLTVTVVASTLGPWRLWAHLSFVRLENCPE